jgi:DNA-binding MarR family transcriptional regulator
MSESPTLPPLSLLVDEVVRTGTRLRSAFAGVRQEIGLGESEFMVLNAVVEAARAPTAAQIGRSLGRPRQLVQRAADSLAEAGLIAAADNPDHKRAALLVPTEAGRALKRKADGRASEIAARLGAGLDLAEVERTARALGALRRTLESRLREEETA